MTLSSFSTYLFFLAILTVQSVNSASPTPSVDCSSLVLNMADCLSYVSNGSTVDKPEGSCCSGLKTVLRTNAECLCEGFKSSASMGVVLNVTKAMALPAACKVSAPSAAKCGLSLSPATAPALAPEASSPAGNMAPAGAEGADSTSPTMAAGEHSNAPGVAPAQSPGSSGSFMLTTSIASLLFGLAVMASFTSF